MAIFFGQNHRPHYGYALYYHAHIKFLFLSLKSGQIDVIFPYLFSPWTSTRSMASSDDTGLMAGLGDAAAAAAGSMRPPVPPGEGDDPVGMPPEPGGPAAPAEGLDKAEEEEEVAADDWDAAMALCPFFSFSVLIYF